MSERNQSSEVTIWNRSGDLFKVFDAAIDEFRKAHPNVKVNHQAVDIDAKLANTLITRRSPTQLLARTSRTADEHSRTSPESDRRVPQRDTNPYKLSVNTVDGRIYGVPWDLDPGLLWYREDLLEDAGVDPEGIATYDDLMDTRNGREGETSRPAHHGERTFLGARASADRCSPTRCTGATSLADADGTRYSRVIDES
ncbi:ABC transporter substrate-binding protein [Streptomyces sp. DHE17-7]|uniref:ABC transporter substrate-binding protein n=1 Tax=Streptomyces sp. DHE17-7 TaxID=2759949 RepID=UPI0022EAFF97|nr:extracellular solute-binding protein [Streptomyces sp. DHE17-7]